MWSSRRPARHAATMLITRDPISLGLAPAVPEELVGGVPAHNAEVVRRVLGGEHGAHRNIVVLNAAAGLWVSGTVDTLGDEDVLQLVVERLRFGLVGEVQDVVAAVVQVVAGAADGAQGGVAGGHA